MCGRRRSFYLDFTGKIVAKKSEKDVVYGYLNNLWKDYETGETVKAQIFTENNRWVELEFKEKFKFNGTSSNAAMFYNNCINWICWLFTYCWLREASKEICHRSIPML